MKKKLLNLKKRVINTLGIKVYYHKNWLPVWYDRIYESVVMDCIEYGLYVMIKIYEFIGMILNPLKKPLFYIISFLMSISAVSWMVSISSWVIGQIIGIKRGKYYGNDIGIEIENELGIDTYKVNEKYNEQAYKEKIRIFKENRESARNETKYFIDNYDIELEGITFKIRRDKELVYEEKNKHMGAESRKFFCFYNVWTIQRAWNEVIINLLAVLPSSREEATMYKSTQVDNIYQAVLKELSEEEREKVTKTSTFVEGEEIKNYLQKSFLEISIMEYVNLRYIKDHVTDKSFVPVTEERRLQIIQELEEEQKRNKAMFLPDKFK